MPPLILASTSIYRRELLLRLRLPFDCVRPQVEETPLPGETPFTLAQRLAAAKAAAVVPHASDIWVIGADQVAELDGQPLGKPGDAVTARAQLAAMSGRTVRFHTAVCLQRGARTLHACDLTEVQFRDLHADAIARYVDAEQPLDCAGSFKCEGLGISLFRAINTQDPTALIGLPLIALAGLLREAGYLLP
ncbi:Maf family protein [Xanthomonas albilineans]|uniref:Maf family protein n=1 Tax=Xanthomonas albilineans TaxID=29447 RepID=UPI0005F33330|nr:Maf family nucleotide pyrophosphatase [Xanthomonas albilineans]